MNHSILEELNDLGFSRIENFYSQKEVDLMVGIIDQIGKENDNFRKSTELFAVRQFLKEVPQIKDLIINKEFKLMVNRLLGPNNFILKSIYFDKPERSNWFVGYHQDLTISVDRKMNLENYGPWTIKNNQFSVQPPIEFLENITTFRIHLDPTDKDNGALKVIPGSHQKKIIRTESSEFKNDKELICEIGLGGIMLMKPLILHGSNRTKNGKRRRVIHIEIANLELPNPLNWSEKIPLN